MSNPRERCKKLNTYKPLVDILVTGKSIQILLHTSHLSSCYTCKYKLGDVKSKGKMKDSQNIPIDICETDILYGLLTCLLPDRKSLRSPAIFIENVGFLENNSCTTVFLSKVVSKLLVFSQQRNPHGDQKYQLGQLSLSF